VGEQAALMRRPAYERCMAAARAALGDAAFDAAWQTGRALSWEQAVDEALALLAEQGRKR